MNTVKPPTTRAAFALTIPLGSIALKVKAYSPIKASAADVRRSTRTAEGNSVKQMLVDAATGEVVSGETKKVIVRADNTETEVSDADLAALRLPNGAVRLVGAVRTFRKRLIGKGVTYTLVPEKGETDTYAALALYVGGMGSLVIEYGSRNSQHLARITADLSSGGEFVLHLQEVAYAQEEAPIPPTGVKAADYGTDYPAEYDIVTQTMRALSDVDNAPESSYLAKVAAL